MGSCALCLLVASVSLFLPHSCFFLGCSFVGVPMVVLGHNDHIAWAVTNVGSDVQDMYIMSPGASKNTYMYKGASVPYNVSTEVIKVRGDEDEVIQVRTCVHGRVMSDNDAIMLDADNDVPFPFPLAMRWTSTDHSVLDTTLEAFLQVSFARNFSEFRSALSTFVAPSQNFIFADVNGNIGYQMPGLVPIRSASHTGAWPVPGNGSAEYEWQGFLTYDQLPRTFNPPEGYIATANQRLTPASFPHRISTDFAVGYRGKRIFQVLDETLANGGKMDIPGMAALVGDVKSLFAVDLIATLSNIPVASLTTAGSKLRSELQAWNAVMSVGDTTSPWLVRWVERLSELAAMETHNDYWKNGAYLLNM
jgi:penicillin G amidase